MGVKIATTCLHWSQSISSSPSTSSSHNHNYNRAASSISNSSFSSSRRRNRGGGGGNKQTLVCRVVHGPYRSSTLFQSTSSSTILRTQSCEFPKSKSRNQSTIRRSLSTNNTEGFSDEEFQREIKELAKRFEIWDDEDENDKNTDAVFNCRNDEEEEEEEGDNINTTTTTTTTSNSNLNEDSSKIVSNNRSFPSSKMDSVGPPWLGIRPDPPEWTGLHDMIPASIARKANSVDIPFSLRMLKRKTQWQEGFREAGESACCSVKKAFSSMVFIIRELQSYTLQMRQVLFYEDLQEILVRVQKEMNDSFVWLFQQIFSHTPTLMVYVMILLANFTVYSMAQNTAIAGIPTMEAYGVTTEIVSMKEDRINPIKPKYDPSVMKMTIISGNEGGGGTNIKSVTGSGTDGEDGRIDGLSSFTHHEIVSDELSKVTSFVNPTTTEETEVGKRNQGEMGEEERKLWNSVVGEAYRMQAVSRDETLDQETMQRFVSPIKVDIEPEDYSVYARTELLYKEAVSREPTNSTILSNYAQFLYLVIHDHDRAEEYFKRAALVEPADAEALSRYADFLWLARKDIGAAEETYIEAIEADPGNTYHAGNYAHFLWNTGGEDTCYYEPEASNEA